MTRSPKQLREDALAIWHAGVDAVRSDRLVEEHVRVHDTILQIGDEDIDLATVNRFIIIGAGKAGAGMAAGLEAALGPTLLQEKKVIGWVNVPADCVRPLQQIYLHAARPASVNEPTEAGIKGTEKILQLVEASTPNDMIICLISGGGSALLPAPVDGITLADKQRVTRFLSGAGANIAELNTVRKHLSRVKGGGLARASQAGRFITLIISDVLGDPLDLIASGPTVADTSTSVDALAVLEKYGAQDAGMPEAIFDVLRAKPYAGRSDVAAKTPRQVTNIVIGNNAAAVDAAGMEAERRGYSHAMHASRELEQQAEDVGRHLAKMATHMRDQAGPDCLITGGEPVVKLVASDRRGLGGRNQQLALAALIAIAEAEGICLLSGGTDGEDGPTDAAGAIIDASVLERIKTLGLDTEDYLARNDAYHIFAAVDALIKTGPTHTNVCDLRVVVVDRVETPH